MSFHGEVTLLYSEVDPALHAAVAAGRYGQPPPPGADPAAYPSSTVDYAPRHFLVNGRPYSPGAPPLAAGSAGQRLLLRLLNAGLSSHAPMLLGASMRMVAEDGRPYPFARVQHTVLLPALKSLDAVVEPSGAADRTYPLLDRRLFVKSPSAAPGAGQGPGGLMSFLSVSGAPTAPTGLGEAFSVAAGGTLTVAAPGVLANDGDPNADPLTAALVSKPAHGSLTLSPDGSFVYVPAPGYSGPDGFTYKAFDGAHYGDALAVSLTVTP